MSPMQSKLARTALGWSLDDAARESGLSRITILRFEKGGEESCRIKESTTMILLQAYVKQGVQLVRDGEVSKDGGEGIRLAKE